MRALCALLALAVGARATTNAPTTDSGLAAGVPTPIPTTPSPTPPPTTPAPTLSPAPTVSPAPTFSLLPTPKSSPLPTSAAVVSAAAGRASARFAFAVVTVVVLAALLERG